MEGTFLHFCAFGIIVYRSDSAGTWQDHEGAQPQLLMMKLILVVAVFVVCGDVWKSDHDARLQMV